MSHSIQIQIIAALVIIALLGLAGWAYRAAQKASAQGYDLGYDDAKRGHELRIADQQHEIEHLQLKAANQCTAHMLERDAIMQDADNRIAAYARRANPFNEQDRITLQAAANQLDVAANTYSGLQAGDQVRFARQMQQRLLALAERLDAALKASEQPAEAPVRIIHRSHLVFGPQGCGKTTNARAIADALGLKDILDDWLPGMSFPKSDTLVLTYEQGDFTPFRRNILSYEQAMRLVDQPKNKAAA